MNREIALMESTATRVSVTKAMKENSVQVFK